MAIEHVEVFRVYYDRQGLMLKLIGQLNRPILFNVTISKDKVT